MYVPDEHSTTTLEVDTTNPVDLEFSATQQLESAYGDRPFGKLHRLTSTYPPVGADTVDLDRRHRSRHLKDVAAQPRHGSLDLGFAKISRAT